MTRQVVRETLVAGCLPLQQARVLLRPCDATRADALEKAHSRGRRVSARPS